ncbi:MAG: shikimate dehydrogenase [Candidatus Sumerlaeia bacterium]|nr:shikimate dehydrogenase [Candidatus Sumerlaeia bacterium]
MTIRGTTRLLGVIGWPVAHTMSPAIQNAAIAAAGLDYVYVPLPVEPERLADAMPGLGALGFAGVNATVPHKVAVLAHVHQLAESAQLAGAANTIVVGADGLLTGHNTDLPALEERLAARCGERIGDLRGAVVGCGGAGRAAAVALAHAGAGEILLYNRTPGRAEALADQLDDFFPGSIFRPAPWGAFTELADCRAVLHTSTVGLADADESPFDAALLAPGTALIDAVYRPGGTALARAALARGLDAEDGREMLIAQAALAFGIWTGRLADRDAMRQAFHRASAPNETKKETP